MLTASELMTLIKAHNVLSKIKVPAKARKDAAALEKIINEANYTVNHDKKLIQPTKIKRGKSIKLKDAEELTKPKPKKEQTAEQKEKKKTNERKKIVKFILENKDILKEPEIMKLHKGLK
mgnify:FL=1|tara:strand:- start:286 stop:645 length:360 start_codon:yes stop_codon:yes gene_type:complete